MRRRLLSRWMSVEEAVPPDTDHLVRLKDHFWQGDEEMDAVVALFKRLPAGQGRSLFETALNEGIERLADPPLELLHLFEQLDRVPAWVDLEWVERGALVAANSGTVGKACGLFVNMVLTAQGGEVSSATGATGRIQRDPIRRMVESVEFWRTLPVPGGLTRFGAARKVAVRVRLMHAQVRAMLRRRWGADAFAENGCPISNTDMALGIPTFGVINVLYDELFGRRHPREDLDAIHMFWNYIGYLMGVRDDIRPTTPEEAMRQFDFMFATQGPPTEYSDGLNAFSNFFLRTMTVDAGNPIARKALESIALPAVYGLLFHVCGDGPARSMSGLDRPDWVGRCTPAVLKAFYTVAAVGRFLPGHRARHAARSREGDPFWILLSRIVERYAASQGAAIAPTFDGHDRTVAHEAGVAKEQAR